MTWRRFITEPIRARTAILAVVVAILPVLIVIYLTFRGAAITTWGTNPSCNEPIPGYVTVTFSEDTSIDEAIAFVQKTLLGDLGFEEGALGGGASTSLFSFRRLLEIYDHDTEVWFSVVDEELYSGMLVEEIDFVSALEDEVEARGDSVKIAYKDATASPPVFTVVFPTSYSNTDIQRLLAELSIPEGIETSLPYAANLDIRLQATDGDESLWIERLEQYPELVNVRQPIYYCPMTGI